MDLNPKHAAIEAVGQIRRIPTRHRVLAVVAARAAFRTGHDD
jgi:hypothetical protein